MNSAGKENSFLKRILVKRDKTFSELNLVSLPQIGEIKIKLLLYRNSDTVLPYSMIDLHFLKENGITYPVRCLGYDCGLCAHSKENGAYASSKLVRFYADHNGELKVFSAPRSFLSALFGRSGHTSEVIEAIKMGKNPFDAIEGTELLIKRVSIHTGDDFRVFLGNKKTSSIILIEKLENAEPLEKAGIVLLNYEMDLLVNSIKNGEPIGSILERTGSKNGNNGTDKKIA
jgi:hypothetical protein